MTKIIPTCKYCIYCKSNEPLTGTVRCCISPPTKDGWPIIDDDDFCGSWQGVEMDYKSFFKITDSIC